MPTPSYSFPSLLTNLAGYPLLTNPVPTPECFKTCPGGVAFCCIPSTHPVAPCCFPAELGEDPSSPAPPFQILPLCPGPFEGSQTRVSFSSPWPLEATTLVLFALAGFFLLDGSFVRTEMGPFSASGHTANSVRLRHCSERLMGTTHLT